MEKLPVFVYGTLKRGYSNHDHCLKGKYNLVKDGVIPGELYSISYFPGYVDKKKCDQENDLVFGELFWIKDELYEATLSSLDRLEGFNSNKNKNLNMYNRVKKKVKINNNTYEYAWTYVWNGSVSEYKKINNGVWH